MWYGILPANSLLDQSKRKPIYILAITFAMCLVLVLIGVVFDVMKWALLFVIGLEGTFFLLAINEPLVVMYMYFAISFVIYMPVALLKSDYPLLIQDVLLGIALMQTFGLRRKEPLRLLGDSRIVTVSLVLYVGAVLLALISENIVSFTSAIYGLRTLLFGIGFLILSSVWMNSARAIDGFLRIYVLGALFAALFGLRQFFFGLLPFELEHLATKGATLGEMLYLGRIRIPSSFLDPVAFGFVMLTALFMLPSARSRLLSRRVMQRGHFLVLGLLLFGLVSSLSRGALVALVVGVAFLYLKRRRRVLAILGRILLAVAVVLALNYVAISVDFAQSDNAVVRNIGGVVDSVWSIFPLISPKSLSYQQQVLRTLSVEYRLRYANEVFAFLMSHPLGGGVGTLTTRQSRYTELPSGDIGYLRLATETGWPGLLTFLGFFFSIPLVAYQKLRLVSDNYSVILGHQFIGLWVAYATALLSYAYLETEALSAIVWTIGGILLNLDVIAARGSLRDNPQTTHP